MAAALQRWARPLRRVARSPGSQEDLEALCSYLLFTTDFPARPLQRLLQRIVGDVEKTDMITTAQRLRRQGHREGHEAGMARGMAKGLAKGLARGNRDGQVGLLESLMTAKFGPLDAATQRRLRRATTEQIARWSIAILTARTLRRVFAGD